MKAEVNIIKTIRHELYRYSWRQDKLVILSYKATLPLGAKARIFALSDPSYHTYAAVSSFSQSLNVLHFAPPHGIQIK